jgi:hypothetical protein
MGGNSGSPQYQNTGITQQQSAPWVRAQPFLQFAMNRGKALYGGDFGYRPYTGPTLAPVNGQLQNSFGMIRDVAGNNPITRAATQYARGILGGEGLGRGPAGGYARGVMEGEGAFRRASSDRSAA